MAWNSNVPRTYKEKFKDSQPKLNENFGAINTFLEADHLSFGVANEGKHARMTMPTVSGVSTGPDEVALFSGTSIKLEVPMLAYLLESGASLASRGFSKPYDEGRMTILPSGVRIYIARYTLIQKHKKGSPFTYFDAKVSDTGTGLGFSNVYWAAMFIRDATPLHPVPSLNEVDAVAYFWGVPSPNVLRFTIWQRSEYNVFGASIVPCSATVLAIGD